ncbi:MAG: 6-phosphogluconolactonase [Calditrichaeota bacterium]|nr:6-phosphogluconolactonase [Calditrichota bacterium]
MNFKIKIFDTPDALSDALALEFQRVVIQKKYNAQSLVVALSGGSTPARFFAALTRLDRMTPIPWDIVQFFWGDERCVAPDHEESNFGMAKKLLFDHVAIPEKNIHRIKGEADPEHEALRYRKLIEKFVPQTADGFPRFDWIFLGMGEDGHTASIFPDADAVKIKNEWTTVARHPQSGQQRITLTLPVINRAERITFLVTGKKKAALTQKILAKNPSAKSLPASKVSAEFGIVEWYLDSEAGLYINNGHN